MAGGLEQHFWKDRDKRKKRDRETRAVVALVRLVRGGCPQKIYILLCSMIFFYVPFYSIQFYAVRH